MNSMDSVIEYEADDGTLYRFRKEYGGLWSAEDLDGHRVARALSPRGLVKAINLMRQYVD